MMKKILIFFLVFLLLTNTVFAALPPDVPPSTVKGELNLEIVDEYGYAVYGKPENVAGNEKKYSEQTKQIEWRYLGYDINGNLFRNKYFPNDADSGRQPWEKNWVKEPWFEGLCEENYYEGAAEWLDLLEWGNHTHPITGDRLNGEKLKDYFLITSPRTEYTQGVFSGWHRTSNGKVWYQTFSVDPEKKLTLYDEVRVEFREKNTNKELRGHKYIYPNKTGAIRVDYDPIEDYRLIDPSCGYYDVKITKSMKVITVVFWYEEQADTYMTISGEANPNPIQLSGDEPGRTNLEVTCRVSDLQKNEQIQKYEITIKPQGLLSQTKTINSNQTDINTDFEITGIERDITVDVKGKAWTSSGKILNAETREYILTQKEVVSEIHPKLDAEIVPSKIIEFARSEWDNNKKKVIRLQLDAYGSTASEGIKEYMFYYRVSKDRGWKYSGWVSDDKYTFDDVEVYAKDFDSSGNIEIDCRVWIKDNIDNKKSTSDDAEGKKKIIVPPPGTDVHIPEKVYPEEVTSTGRYENIITLDYSSPENIEYQKSIVSLYKILDNGDLQPVFENREQVERNVTVTGKEKEEFRIKGKVVDILGNESEWDTEDYVIESASPNISAEWDTSEVENGKLKINVVNNTPSQIESIYPTRYTNWIVYDAFGKVLNQGNGKAPESIDMNERYYANVATIVQYATNILGNTAKDSDSYINNSLLNLEVDPNRLYTGELTKVISNSKGIKGEIYKIAKGTSGMIPKEAYEDLILDVNNKFTKNEAGNYIVKSEGPGAYSGYEIRYQYANTRSSLREDPKVIAQAEIHNEYGENSSWAYESEKWNGSIERGVFENKGSTYKFRRRYKVVILKIMDNYDTEEVEFLNGFPVADFSVSGHLKMYKKITLNGSNSVNVTNAELQKKYPLLFDHEKTIYVIEPLDAINGNTDYSKNKYIKGIGIEIQNGKVVFKGKKVQDIRIDLDGAYRISYKVFNGLKESKWVSKEIVVTPEGLVTADINVFQNTVFRNPDDNLKAEILVTATYHSPDDTIDFSKTKMLVMYDNNKDRNFENDGVYSTQYVMRDQNNLQSYLSIKNKQFTDTKAIIRFIVDNPEKNMLGRFKFEFIAIEKPTIPNFDLVGDIVELSANTFNLNDNKKIVLLDNQKPNIDLLLGKKIPKDIWMIDTSTVTDELNIDYMYREWENRRENIKAIHYIKKDGTVILYEKKNGVITNRIVSK